MSIPFDRKYEFETRLKRNFKKVRNNANSETILPHILNIYLNHSAPTTIIQVVV